MGIYQKGDHVKIEATNEHSRESEWMWLLVGKSDDEQEIVFGQLDSEPVVANEMRVGQLLAVSYDRVCDHRRFDYPRSRHFLVPSVTLPAPKVEIELRI
jgi:hypothetical protein